MVVDTPLRPYGWHRGFIPGFPWLDASLDSCWKTRLLVFCRWYSTDMELLLGNAIGYSVWRGIFLGCSFLSVIHANPQPSLVELTASLEKFVSPEIWKPRSLTWNFNVYAHSFKASWPSAIKCYQVPSSAINIQWSWITIFSGWNRWKVCNRKLICDPNLPLRPSALPQGRDPSYQIQSDPWKLEKLEPRGEVFFGRCSCITFVPHNKIDWKTAKNFQVGFWLEFHDPSESLMVKEVGHHDRWDIRS